jgi:regulatory protein YycI of two-component signal transduction system YycFG
MKIIGSTILLWILLVGCVVLWFQKKHAYTARDAAVVAELAAEREVQGDRLAMAACTKATEKLGADLTAKQASLDQAVKVARKQATDAHEQSEDIVKGVNAGESCEQSNQDLVTFFSRRVAPAASH